jgi:hypothetical protein
VADQTGIDRPVLDQAAADGSITQARTRAVDPVPLVSEPGGATLEPVLQTNDPDVGVNRRLDPEVQAVDGTTPAPAPIAGARRRLSPRPVPVSRRRRPPAPATATDEEPTPAEEMDDVGTQDEKATAAEADKAGATPGAGTDTPAGVGTTTGAGVTAGSGATATATKTARPKTAAEIVAEQRAREKAAAETPAAGTGAADSEDAAPSAAKDPAGTSVTKPVSKVPVAATRTGASGNRPAGGKSTAAAGSGKGKQALTSVGSGVRKLRNLIASLIWLIAVLAAAVLALGALFTALDQTNQSNEIVRWILERGHDLVGPFKDLFRLETAKNTLLVNWGIAALVYLIAGKIIERFVRP